MDAASPTAEPTPPTGRVKKAIEVVKLPPPTPERVLADRMSGAVYLAAWLLHVTHIVLWVLVIFGALTGRWWTVAASLTASVATWATVGLVVHTHGRIGDDDRSLPRRVLSRWWRGPWDPVGRQVWLPVLLADAWRAVRGR